MAAGSPFSASATHFVALIAEDGGSSSYDKWANSYEVDVNSMNYAGHKSVCLKWQSYHNLDLAIGRSSSEVAETVTAGEKHKMLDAGCGTGLVGEVLTSLVSSDAIEIYGGDVSTNMLEVAKSKNVYADLKIVNLKEELPYDANSFDSILCSGVFGIGHCGPECVPNLLRVLKPGSYFIATINREIYDETRSEWVKQIKQCDCELIEDNEMPYRESAKAIVMVIRKPLDTNLRKL